MPKSLRKKKKRFILMIELLTIAILILDFYAYVKLNNHALQIIIVFEALLITLARIVLISKIKNY